MKPAVFVLALAVVAGAAQADTLKLAPSYDVAGTNPNGSHYSGKASVQILSDTTFAIQWRINGDIYKGFGMRRNDTLAATYLLNGEPGLVIYMVDGDGLDGLWAVRGENGNGSEHLTPSP